MRDLDVVSNPGRAPHVVGGVLITRIVDRKLLCHDRPGICEIGQLRLVELLEYVGLDLALQEISCRNDDIIA